MSEPDTMKKNRHFPWSAGCSNWIGAKNHYAGCDVATSRNKLQRFGGVSKKNVESDLQML